MFHTWFENISLIKGCQHCLPIEQRGTLSCYSCYDKGPRFSRSHLKDRPVTSYYKPWVTRAYSNPDPHFFVVIAIYMDLITT